MSFHFLEPGMAAGGGVTPRPARGLLPRIMQQEPGMTPFYAKKAGSGIECGAAFEPARGRPAIGAGLLHGYGFLCLDEDSWYDAKGRKSSNKYIYVR